MSGGALSDGALSDGALSDGALSDGALSGVRVLEFVDESAEYCGRLLAGLGADVVKAEPPQGAPSRSIGPYLDDDPGPDRSLAFWADNLGKRSVVARDDGDLLALCASADVFVHTLRARQSPDRADSISRPSRASSRASSCALSHHSDSPALGPNSLPTTSS